MTIETTRSIRAYFLFFGLMRLIMSYPLPGEQELFLSFVSLALGIGYVFVGLALPSLLVRSTWWINTLLGLHLGYSSWRAWARYRADPDPEVFGLVVRLVAGVCLTLLVFSSLRRLAATAQNEAQTPAFSQAG